MGRDEDDGREAPLAARVRLAFAPNFALMRAFMWLERILWVGFALFAVFMTITIFIAHRIGDRVFAVVTAVICYLLAYVTRRVARAMKSGIDDTLQYIDRVAADVERRKA